MSIDPAKTDGQLAVATHDPTLAEITRRLVETYRPERIYLFGSRARGTAGAGSDDDLLVVVRDDAPLGLRRSARAYQALWGLPTSGGILIWTHTAFVERLHLRASLPSTVERGRARTGSTPRGGSSWIS